MVHCRHSPLHELTKLLRLPAVWSKQHQTAIAVNLEASSEEGGETVGMYAWRQTARWASIRFGHLLEPGSGDPPHSVHGGLGFLFQISHPHFAKETWQLKTLPMMEYRCTSGEYKVKRLQSMGIFVWYPPWCCGNHCRDRLGLYSEENVDRVARLAVVNPLCP